MDNSLYVTNCKMLHQNKLKQTLEREQYGLEIIFKDTVYLKSTFRGGLHPCNVAHPV